MIEWEIEELAYMSMGKTEEEVEKEINKGDIDQAIYDKYECSFETYCDIVKDLLPFTPKHVTALGKEAYHAFVSGNRMVARMKVEKQ